MNVDSLPVFTCASGFHFNCSHDTSVEALEAPSCTLRPRLNQTVQTVIKVLRVLGLLNYYRNIATLVMAFLSSKMEQVNPRVLRGVGP